MGQLTNQYVSSSYQGLLKMTDSTQGLTNTLQTIQTGDGDNSPLQMSFTEVNISGSFFINNVPITNGTNGTSGTSGVAGSSGTSGSSGSNGSSGTSGQSGSSGSGGTSGSSGTSPADLNRAGLITTGSIAPTTIQSITGSLIVSNSFYVGNNSTLTGGGGITLENRSSNSTISLGNPTSSAINLLSYDFPNTYDNELFIQTNRNATQFKEFNILNGNVNTFMLISGSNATGSAGIRPVQFLRNVDITGSLGITNIIGTGSLFLQPNQADVRFVEIYNTSPTDTHITASGGQIFLGNDETYIKVDNYGSVKRIDIVADNLVNVSGSMNVTGSIDITGQYLVNGVAFSGGTNGTSGTSGSNGTDGSSGTSGSNGSDGSSGTSGSDGTSGTSAAVDYTGLITTGSLGTSQFISGSLTNFGGNTTFQQTGQTLSNQVTQSVGGANILFGLSQLNAGYLQAQYTGSLIISGSNNITPSFLLNPFDVSSAPDGTYSWYISGSNNILNASNGASGLALNNSAVAKPAFNSNIGPGSVTLTLTSSSLSQPNISNNILLGGFNSINHPSGSVIYQNNILTATINSIQNYTPGKARPTISNNIITNGVGLNHISSSITFAANIGGGLTVNNHVSSSFTAATNGITVSNNNFGGTSHVIYASGSSSSAQARVFSNNFIGGNANIISSSYVGSNNAHLFSNIIFGQNLFVSASNASTSGGSAFFGRFNATGSLQESSQETVFVVGTGTSAGARRNALHIDSGSNIRMTGSVNISGSLNVTDKINNLKIWTGSATVNSIGIGNNTLNANSGSDRSNIAIGNNALKLNVTGSNIVAIGNSALENSQDSFNTAIGASALTALITGSQNMVFGQSGAQALVEGSKNVAIGFNTMVNVVSGSFNTAIGTGTLQRNVSGSGCVVIGNQAGGWSTTSNEFFIHNDALGSADNERSGSLMWGNFANPISSQNLQINANTKIVGDVMFSSGSNKTMGTVALDGGNPGTATVSNSLVTANSLIFLTKQTLNHTNGYVAVSSKGSSTFTITSNHNGDTDTVAYQIINPA